MISGSLVKTVTSDGLELAGFFVDNNSDTAVFQSHGTSGDFYTHKFIEEEAQLLSKKRLSFLTANNRGHDVIADIRKYVNGKTEWTQGGGAFGKFEDCLLDISAWLDFLEKQGIKKVILQAHSLTQKILYYQFVKKDKRVIGQIHISPCNDAGYMFYLLGEKKYKKTNAWIESEVKKGKVKNFLPKELAVVCPMGALAYSGYLTEEGTGNLFPYHNPMSKKWRILEQTREPLLAIYGGDDVFIKPSIVEAAKIFKDKLPKAEVRIIKGASHSYLDYEQKLCAVIGKWIEKLI